MSGAGLYHLLRSKEKLTFTGRKPNKGQCVIAPFIVLLIMTTGIVHHYSNETTGSFPGVYGA